MTAEQQVTRLASLRWLSVVLGVAVSVALFLKLSSPPASTDLWWHLVLGKEVLNSGSLVVDHSLFSWSPAESHYVYNSWLGDILLYLVDRVAGNGGLVALRYLVFVGIALLAWFYAKQRAIDHHPGIWVIVFIGLEMMVGNSEIKPELFSMGFMALTVWLYYHIRAYGEQRCYLPYVFPLIIVVWINVHGAFFIVSLFFAMVLLGELLNTRLSPQQSMPKTLRKHFVAAMLLCFPALLINPYGYELPQHIIHSVLSDNVTGIEHIIAYFPTYLYNGPPLFLMDYLLIALLLFILLIWQKMKHGQTDWVVAFSFIGYSLLYFSMGRVTYFLGPVFIFGVLDLLAYRERSWLWPTRAMGDSILATALLLLTFVLVGRIVFLHECNIRSPDRIFSHITDNSKRTLQLEVDFIARHLPGKRIGNVYEDGGYLMYRFWPEKKVLIDPRAFPYRSWIERYFEFMHGGKAADDFMKDFTPDFWVVRYEKIKLFEWLVNSKEWRIAFLGPIGGVFVPATSQPQTVTISSEIAQLDSRFYISKAIISALKLDDLAFVEDLYTATLNKLDHQCWGNKVFLAEMSDVVTGMRLFHDKAYVEAAKWLVKPSRFLHTKRKAISGLLLLAQQKLDEGDESGAHELVAQAFDMISEQTTLDLYNLMVAEWHYSTVIGNSHESYIKLTWQQLADSIIDKRGEIEERYHSILDVAQSMKEGRYAGDARFLVLETAPYSATDEKNAAGMED